MSSARRRSWTFAVPRPVARRPTSWRPSCKAGTCASRPSASAICRCSSSTPWRHEEPSSARKDQEAVMRDFRTVAAFAAFAVIAALSTPVLAQRAGPPGPPIQLQLGTTLATPPLLGSVFLCQAVNVGPTEVLVSVEIFDNAGTQISVSGDGTDPLLCRAAQLIQPNHSC